jgi:acyl carrier protein
MDRGMNLAPPGVMGECCVGGAGVARGYLNRPQLSREKFIDNPYNSRERLYRSGDLVCWVPAGGMEYLGRIDQQVKIRGFRIELGEIEAQLLTHHLVKEAVVLNHKNETGENHLYAFIVTRSLNSAPSVPERPGAESERINNPFPLNIGEIKAHLLQTLPEYMIPAHFMQVERIPLTPNGKINRVLLLSSKTIPFEAAVTYAPLENEAERRIAEVWKEILKCERVGRNDNFFDLGGNSINALRVITRLKEDFDMEIPVISIFEYPTVGIFSQYVIREGKVGNSSSRGQPKPASVKMRDMHHDTIETAIKKRHKQQTIRGRIRAND